jgi:hypothetical protein
MHESVAIHSLRATPVSCGNASGRCINTSVCPPTSQE